MNFIVENWRSGWRWISTNCFFAIAAFHAGMAFALTPEQQIEFLRNHGCIVNYATATVAIIGFFGRFVSQGAITEQKP